jgi:sucrose phosphorylase
MDRVQSIFCVSNVSDQTQLLDLSDLNLIDTENWHDLISGNQFDEANHLINLAPYQTVWITNQ